MSTSKYLTLIYNMLSFDEGIRHTAYYCPANHLTVGIGHNLDADPAMHILRRRLNVGDTITTAEIQQLFAYDVANVEKDLTRRIFWYKNLPTTHKFVLINLCFNLGINRLLKFVRFLQALQKNDIPTAVKELRASRYYKQVPKRAERIIAMLENKPVREYGNYIL